MNNELNNRGVDVPQNQKKKIPVHSIVALALSAAAVLIIFCLEGILFLLLSEILALRVGSDVLPYFLYIIMFVVLAIVITAFIMGLRDSTKLSRAAGIGSLIFCVGFILTIASLVLFEADLEAFNICSIAISINVFLALTMLGILTLTMRKGDNRKIPVGVALLCLGGYQIAAMFGYVTTTLGLLALLFTL